MNFGKKEPEYLKIFIPKQNKITKAKEVLKLMAKIPKLIQKTYSLLPKKKIHINKENHSNKTKLTVFMKLRRQN